MMLIGLPSTLPPKSSTAICAAVTEPWPVGVEAGPFMSVRTPILTTSSEIWARAACDDKAAAANAASTDSFLTEIKTVLPLSFGTSAVLLDRELELGPAGRSCNYSTARVNGTDGLRPRSRFGRR